jgi:hypothetical protein
MENYWEGWGFTDRIPTTISATPRKLEILKIELKKSFPDNQIDEIDAKNIRFYAKEEQLKKLKKFVATLNGKVYYENGGKLDSNKLVYVLYEPTPRAIKILNENGRTYLSWWQSDLTRGDSERLLQKLQIQNLILGGLRYTGDTSDLKFEQGGNIGEVLATSNPYIGGAKVIQGIAPESVSAIDKKTARQIYPDPNRPVFFSEGGQVRKLDLHDAVMYKGETWFYTEKNGVKGITNTSQGAWGSNYPFIPLTKLDVDKDLTDMYGRKVKFSLGGGVSVNYDVTKKPDENGLYFIVFTKNGKKVPNSKIPTNLGYGKIKNEFQAKRKKYDTSLGLQDAIFISMKMNEKFDNGGATGSADYSVAKIILEQLGGQGKLVVMTGAYNFIAFPNGLSFKLKSRKANYVKITLNAMDLYDVQFQKLFGMKSKVVAEYDDLYFDQLIPIIEKETGMYLKLFKKGGFVNTQNRDMVIGQLKTIHHHEQEMLNTLKNSGEVEAWVLSKVSNASSDLSDVAHYLEFNK